jgi:phage gp36-like protein
MTAYCDKSDLTTLGIPAAALQDFSDADKDAAIEAFSSEADGYLSSRYTTPLTTWPRSLRMHVARGAVYILITQRGMNPNSLGNELIIKGYDDAISYLTKVSRGVITLPVSVTAPAVTVAPDICSDTSRGWDDYL